MTDTTSTGIVSTGSRVYAVGTVSGIDTSALLDAAVAQKNYPADQIDIQVTENEALITAYDGLQELAIALQDSLEQLVQNEGFSISETDIYQTRQGTISSASSTDPSTLMSVTIDENSDLGTYALSVEQVATTQKIGSTATVASSSDALSYTGSFTIGLEDVGSTSIAVDATMSLSDIAAAINAELDTTGVSATVLQVAEDDFQLILSGQNTNKQITITDDSGTVMESLGVIDGVGAIQNEIVTAKAGIITVDGVTVTRDDNDFSDVIDGINIDILSAEPGTTLTLDVTNNSDGTYDLISNFVDSYNAFRAYYDEATSLAVSDDTEVDTGLLFGDSLTDYFQLALSDIIASSSSNSGIYTSMADIGITFDENNYLEIDEFALSTALIDNYDDVQALFQTSYDIDDDNFAVIRNESLIGSIDIEFDITLDGDGDISSVSANGDADAFTFDGNSIIGAAGTQYDGLRFAYVGTTDATVNISISGGIADQFEETIERYANTIDGLFQQEKAGLEDVNEDLETEAAEIRARTERYQEIQIERYAEFETKLAALEVLRDQIRAILGIKEDD